MPSVLDQINFSLGVGGTVISYHKIGALSEFFIFMWANGGEKAHEKYLQ